MADNDDIVQNIKINVDSEGFSAFDKLKEAAQNAFEGIKQVFSGDLGGGFEKIRESSARAFESIKEIASQAFSAVKGAGSGAFSELGEILAANAATIGRAILGIAAAFAGVATVIGIAGKAVFNFVESQAKVGEALEKLSTKTQTAAGDVASMETALSKAGVSTQEFASGYGKLAEVVGNTWDKIKKEVATGAAEVEEKSIAAAKAQQRLAETERERSGIKPDANTKAVEESLAKELQLREATLNAKKADKASDDAQKNSIEAVTKGVQELLAGSEGALKSFNATAENIVRGIVAAAGQGGDVIKGLGENFAAVGSKAPGAAAVLEKLGEALKQIEDPALRSKVAIEALGPAGDKFLRALDSGKINDFGKSLQGMSGAADGASAKMSGAFMDALSGLDKAIENVKTRMATAFGGDFTEILEKLDGFFTRNQETFGKLADTVSSVLMPPLKAASTAFVAIGESISLVTDVVTTLVRLFGEIGKLSLGGITQEFKNLYDIIKAIGEILSGNVKKGLEDLAKVRKNISDQEKKEKDDAKKTSESDIKKKSEDATQKTKKPDETDPKKIPMQDTSDAQRERAKQNAEDQRLQEAFKKFQDSLPKERFPDLSKEMRDAADFQKFKEQPQAKEPAKQETGAALDSLKESPRAALLDAARGFLDAVRQGLADLTKKPEDQLPKPGDSSFLETLKKAIGTLGVSEAKALDAPEGLKPRPEQEPLPGTKPEVPAPTPAPSQFEGLVQQLINAISALGLKTGEKITGPDAATGTGIRGDAATGGGAEQASQALQSTASSAQAASSALDGIASAGQQVATIGESASTASSSLQGVSSAADSVSNPLQSLASAAQSAASALQSLQSQGGGGTTVSAAEGGHIKGPGTETSDSIPAWLSHNEFVQPARATRHYGVAFMEAIRNLKFPKFADGGLASAFDTAAGFARGGLAGSVAADGPSTQRAVDTLSGWIKELGKRADQTDTVLREHNSRITKLENESSNDGAVEAAFGGWIRGAGTETSDSIPAWLSHNEFVQPAKATRHYGVEFMEAVRTLQFPKFNAGGVVNLFSPQMPRFKDGGMVTAASALDKGGSTMQHLGEVDLRTDHGSVRVSIDRDGLSQLRRAAVQRNIGSDKKPSWVR